MNMKIRFLRFTAEYWEGSGELWSSQNISAKEIVFFSHKNYQNSTNKGFLFTLGRMCYTTRVEKITVTVRGKFEMAKMN